MLAERGREVPAEDETATRLLAELSDAPLSVNDAIRIALANNPQIKVEYTRLGFAAADVYDAGRLSNPVLSAWMLVPDTGGEADQVGFGLAQSFTDILLLRSRSRFAAGEFERAKQVIGANVLNITADTEIAYVHLAGSLQLLAMRETIAYSATVSAALAQQFFEAGNISHLELALQQAEASEATLAVLQAQSEVAVARSALNRLMGLAATEDDWTIQAQLPAPVATEDTVHELLRRADTYRLDLAAARQQVALQADALGVTRSFRWLGDLQVGVETERETDRSRITGPTLAVELPIFNQGEGRIARAQAQLEQAEAELRVLEIDIGNAVQGSVVQVAAARARVAHYHDSLIPLRKEIVARTQQEVNYMLDSPFQLLLAKRLEFDTYHGYLEALRDYWLARAQLARDVGAALPSSAANVAGNGALTIDARSLALPDAATGHAHGAQQDSRPTHGAPVKAQPAQSVHDHHIGETP
jgi:cobalt-zinc-cadmium efflux system outer membrane protein